MLPNIANSSETSSNVAPGSNQLEEGPVVVKEENMFPNEESLCTEETNKVPVFHKGEHSEVSCKSLTSDSVTATDVTISTVPSYAEGHTESSNPPRDYN